MSRSSGAPRHRSVLVAVVVSVVAIVAVGCVGRSSLPEAGSRPTNGSSASEVSRPSSESAHPSIPPMRNGSIDVFGAMDGVRLLTPRGKGKYIFDCAGSCREVEEPIGLRTAPSWPSPATTLAAVRMTGSTWWIPLAAPTSWSCPARDLSASVVSGRDAHRVRATPADLRRERGRLRANPGRHDRRERLSLAPLVVPGRVAHRVRGRRSPVRRGSGRLGTVAPREGLQPHLVARRQHDRLRGRR